MRPANIVTSVADVLAGIAVSGFFSSGTLELIPVILLCLSTIGLYGGGIVFNDVFDAELDRVERPERAIPSGAVGIREAIILGSILLLTGILAAFLLSTFSGIIASLIALFALIYNKFAKHHAFLGPLNMGLCRGLNLLLGISILSAALNQYYFLGIIPLIYIFSVTMISQGEVYGGNRTNLYIASFLYISIIGFISYLSFAEDQLLYTLIFLLPFALMIFKPLIKAMQDPDGQNIGKAVKAGVISIILMDAAWAAVFGALYAALFIACLLPLSLWLGKRFAVS